ncbi:unnamed protein product, partial [Sphenostylis stenocarpa]
WFHHYSTNEAKSFYFPLAYKENPISFLDCQKESIRNLRSPNVRRIGILKAKRLKIGDKVIHGHVKSQDEGILKVIRKKVDVQRQTGIIQKDGLSKGQ